MNVTVNSLKIGDCPYFVDPIQSPRFAGGLARRTTIEPAG